MEDRVDRRLAGTVFGGLGAGAAIISLIIGPLHAEMTALATTWTAAAIAPRVDAQLWPLLALAARACDGTPVPAVRAQASTGERQAEAYA